MAEKMYSISVFKTRGSGEEPIVLASAMNVSSFSILQRSGAKEFITFISRTVAGRTQPNTRQQVVEQEYRAYTHARSDGLACVVCTNEPYPERVAFALCNQTMMSDDLEPDEFNSMFDVLTEEYTKKFDDTATLGTLREEYGDDAEKWRKAMAEKNIPAEVAKQAEKHVLWPAVVDNFFLWKGVEAGDVPFTFKMLQNLDRRNENKDNKRCHRIKRLLQGDVIHIQSAIETNPGPHLLAVLDAFTTKHPKWLEEGSYILYRDYSTLTKSEEIGKDDLAISRVQHSGLCYMHAGAVMQHVVVALNSGGTHHEMLNVAKYIVQFYDNRAVRNHIVDNVGGNSIGFMRDIMGLEGKDVLTTGLGKDEEEVEFMSGKLRERLRKYGIGLVSTFAVEPAFQQADGTSYDGALTEKSLGQHAMAVVGHRKEGNKHYFLLQNWWIEKQFVEVSQDYLASSGQKILSEKTTHGGVSEEQKGMKWSREAAVEWVKQATGLQVPSAFHFRPDNGRLRPIIRLAGEAGASADAYLRSLLGALGGEQPPSGTAQWVLAWLACASAPTATRADFEELVRSVSPDREDPSPRLPGRSADASHSDSADYAAISAAAATAAARASSTAATSAAAAAADPSAASSSAAAPRTPSGIPLPGTPDGDEEVARALQVDVQDTPARRVTFAERPDDIRRLEGQVERLTAMVLELVERSSPPAPQRPSVQRSMEVPPPPPLVDASRVPFGSHHAGAGHVPAPFSAPQPPAPAQPVQENPFAGQHFSAPSQTEVFQQDPLDALERGSVQSQPALITPGPGLLDPRVWLSYGQVEKSLLLVHIRDIFAEVLNGSQTLANDGQHLLHHLSCILHLMDDSSDPEGMVQLAESTLHRLVVLKTGLKAGWSVAADLQKAYHEEDVVGCQHCSPPSAGGRGAHRQQEEGVSVSVLDRFPPPPRATSGGRALLLEPPLSNGERERLVGKANSYIGDALALSTRRGVHSVYRRFLEFRHHWETRFGTPLDVPTAVVLFVTRLLSRELNPISPSTAIQYVVNVQSAEKRLGRPIESQLVRDFVRSLKRAGALRPTKQAVPATKEDVERAVRLESDPVMRLAITLAWQGAARVDDVLTREARNVTESSDFWSVNWVGSKSDPFRLGQVTGVVLPPPQDQTLRSLLRSTRPGQRIFAGVTFRRVVAALKRANQALTGHSLRRGALFRLLRMGVDLDTLRRVSRHSTQDALVRYLPEAEDVPPPAFLEAIRHHGGIGDAPPSDFTPFVTVAYGGDLIVNELAAPPAQRSSEGYLAPITSSFMDLDRLLAMDTHGLLGGVLDVIRSRESFESALVRDASSWHSEAIARGTSRRMLHHLPDLLKYGVAEVAHEHPRVVLPAFTVPKKSGGERFVCDGRKLNAVMPRPPPMLLPSMPDVIDRVLSSAVVYLADAKSYFYQFELDEGVRGYFGMNLAGPRGSFVRARLRAMCMGWSWAPAIAQRASRVILPETDGLPWVDNFIIVGDSLAEAEEKFTRFARRCREVNCVLNDDEGQYGIPLTQFDLLGLRFDLASSPPRYSMATAWVEKLLRSSELAVFRGGAVSPRAFYRLFGALVWFAYTTRFPLAYARCALSFVQRLSSRLSVGGLQAWDVPVNVPASTAREVESLTATIGENRWVTRVGTRGGQSIRLWSDASSKEWAALLEGEPERVSQGIFFGHFAEKHIFLKELFAVLKGLELAVRAHRGVSVELMVDNLPAVHCLNKGHSKNYAANIILSRIFDLAREYGLELTATWVPTHEQRADEYTRGTQAKENATPGGWLPKEEDLSPPPDLTT
ncbi:Synaptobrevin-like protein YKT6 [Diplonema papillatum]|nr:Synaptobrevin-like protein YKT6 [Diplonema papillatum]